MRVGTIQGDPELHVGDFVTATGAMARRDGREALEAATYAKHDDDPAKPPLFDTRLEPRELTMDELHEILSDRARADDAYGSRVRIRARLLNAIERNWGATELQLDFDDIPTTAWLPGSMPPELALDADLKPLLELMGALDFNLDDLRYANIRLMSADEITVVPDAAFARRRIVRRIVRSATWLLPLILALAVVALSAKLIRISRARNRLDAVLAERKRLSADLHDTIEQHLAIAGLYLDSIQDPPNEVRMARETLAAAKRAVRETVWNLRLDDLASKRPEDILRAVAMRLAGVDGVKVGISLKGLPESLGESIFSDILFIVQEAVTNALKHGHAKRIVLASQSIDGGFAIAVSNNGEKFEPKNVPGPEAGHFGLSGMRERARKNKIMLSFKSTRFVTSVRLEVRQ